MMILMIAELLTIVFLGLIFGSFATALIYRVPRKISWGAKRSSCPSCKTNLGPVDLIPIISWCLKAGKCRHCRAPISKIYPLVEILSVILCLITYSFFGLNVESLFIIIAIPFLLALFAIDLKHMILPNQLVFALLVIGFVRLLYFSMADVFAKPADLFMPYFAGALVYAGVSWGMGYVMGKVLKKESLGFGDVKFFFVSGIWLGLVTLPHFFIMSGAIAICFAIFWRLIIKEEVFPFGPALILSFYGLLLFQGSFLI